MKLFISWSGVRSKTIANALRRWLPDVIQTAEPWMSEADIEAGARWNREIDDQLRESQYGIICLTRENQAAPWILFETGAIAKTLVDTFVCPYLIDLEPVDISQGPLTQFQAKRANEKETWDLVFAINNALRENKLPEDRLRRTFDRCWPDLKSVLETLPSEAAQLKPSRSVENMIDEVLQLTRGLSRTPPVDAGSDTLRKEVAYIKNAITSLLAQHQIERDLVEEIGLVSTPRRGSDKTKWMEISVEFPVSDESHESKILKISPRDSISDVLDRIYSMLHKQESSFRPAAYTYLWDWILIREQGQLPLFVKVLHRLIPAHIVFADGERWQVIPLDEPLIYKTERFGIERGQYDAY